MHLLLLQTNRLLSKLLVLSDPVGIRRLNEIGKSGWMMLVITIHITGFIWLIIFNARNS
ncbi:MAG: hypothetical protein VX062_07190 [Bacteroidota bacterium]|nr:hypothetical protein [Bacteroidota bacterium]